MPDREKVISELEEHIESTLAVHDVYADGIPLGLLQYTVAMLKEQEAVVKQWIKEIADNQLAHAPKDSHEFMSLNEHLENEYKRGIWDGLEIAWNIISEGR